MKFEVCSYECLKKFKESLALDSFEFNIVDRLTDSYIDVDFIGEDAVVTFLEPHKVPNIQKIMVGKECIGFVETSLRILKTSNEEGLFITLMVIHPKKQRQGYGKKILKQIISKSHCKFILMHPVSDGSVNLAKYFNFNYDKKYCDYHEYVVRKQ